MPKSTSKVTRVVVVAASATVGLALTAWLAGLLYLELWTSEQCRDLLLRPGRSQSCAAPAAPWWVLLLGGGLGAFVLAAIALRVVRGPAAGRRVS